MGGIYAAMAVGFTLVWGVMKVINLAHCAIGVFSAYVAYWLLVYYGIDPLLSLVLTVPLLFVIGLLIHEFLIKRIVKARDIALTSMVLMFGLSILVENLLLYFWGPSPRLVTTAHTGKSLFLDGIAFPIPSLIGFGISITLLTIIYIFLHGTYVGKAVRATWQDREGAALMGINLDRVSMITFGLATASVGAGGVCMTFMYSFYPSLHAIWLIFMFLVVIVGGVGSVIGVAAGGLILGLFIGVSAVFVPFAWVNVVVFLSLILILLIKPTGLFRR
ncbi:MAG: branched-chain amino acid transporter permease subunit LivH [Candidatus Bathyarchaeota archaeon BA1]|nr:MAG: branched-chain amino acid transporter permease subunit LivH [Candidatus Bathyarchaeota archaeon BA1]